MRHWTFWEWVAYACLLLGAMILAADTGLRVAPELAQYVPLITNPNWGFAPLVLVLFGTFILIASEFGWLDGYFGIRRSLKLFLERDSKTDRLGIQTFPGVTYVQVAVISTRIFKACTFWIVRVEYSPDQHTPFAIQSNERHQCRWSRPSGKNAEYEIDLIPAEPPIRANIGFYTDKCFVYDPPDHTPSNLINELQ